jgi:radical SAM superfamily enzyme YgiQ (UPF0313 family)
MSDILLATLNAKYPHAAFGLRYLFANMGDLQGRTRIQEFDINQRPLEIVEQILEIQPRILGLGIYIWNVELSTEVVRLLKHLDPELRIVVGGPEVSYDCEDLPLIQFVDHVIRGEADLMFASVCRQLLDESPTSTQKTEAADNPNRQVGSDVPRPGLDKFITAPLPEMHQLQLPYDFYTDEDCAHRIIYVEASRGCPYRCEYCLSSLDIPVRTVPLDTLLSAFQRLLDRGVRQFKFVDRTFNLNLQFSKTILSFFVERQVPGLFLHFEMVPDRLPEPLREIIAQFPAGSLQFEIGIQTLNPEIESRISRRQDHARLQDNIRWLRERTGVHLHADLIAGLPGETLESFGQGFDQLLALNPQEIQVGILKRLRGTPIVRHTNEWAMVYSPVAPYEVLQSRSMSFRDLSRMRRMAKFWDIFSNNGNFRDSLPLLWLGKSPFTAFLEFSDALHAQGVKTSGIALTRQYQLLADYLKPSGGQLSEEVLRVLREDYCRSGRRDLPEFLRTSEMSSGNRRKASESCARLPKRQSRHLASDI